MSLPDLMKFGAVAYNFDWLDTIASSQWTGFETQGGRVYQASIRWPRTLRTTGLVLRGPESLLFSGASIDLVSQELFFLEIEPTGDMGSQNVLSSARPPYQPVRQWPDSISLGQVVLQDVNRQVEVGLAICDQGQNSGTCHVMWVAAKSRGETFFIFADAEIPLDVFITFSEETAEIARSVLSARAVAVGMKFQIVTGGS